MESTNQRLVSARFNFDSGDVANYVAIWNSSTLECTVFTKSKYLVSQPIETLSYIDQNSRQLIKVQLDTVDVKYKPGLFRLLQEIIMYHHSKDHKLVSVLENKYNAILNKIYEHQRF